MHERQWVYVLRSVADSSRYYVGLTSNVSARLAEHNSGGCRHTNKYRPWRLHVTIEFRDQPRASAFEQYLKSGSGRAFAKRHFE
jgi:predicted GIY-YIG superfamily endonuclease